MRKACRNMINSLLMQMTAPGFGRNSNMFWDTAHDPDGTLY